MSESKLEIQVLARNLAKEALKQAQDDLKGVGEAAKKSGEEGEKGSKKFGMSLTELKSGIDLAVGGLRTMAEVGKQAFEFAQQGAVVNQTTASFQNMGVSLDELRAAARGTADDMTLMSSTLTLMAGAGPEMQAALGEAAPQLLKMAKAANKLNPTLGDTTFLYQSIATAAKRQSAQIADNLGIVVKQGAAYDAYAKKVGKAVTELTAEEQQLAFLNELLKSGNVLLEQAGNSTESAVDGYARLTTEVGNATAKLQAAADEGLNPFINRAAAFISVSQKAGINLWSLSGGLQFAKSLLDDSIVTLDENTSALTAQETALKRAELTAQAYAAAYTPVLEVTGNSADTFNQYSQALASSEAAANTAAFAAATLAQKQREAADAAADAKSDFLDLASALGEMTMAQVAQSQIDALKNAVEAGTLSKERYADAQERILTQFGLLTPAEAAAQAKLDALTQSFINGTISKEAWAFQSMQIKNSLDNLIPVTAEYGSTAIQVAAAEQAATDATLGTIGAMDQAQQSTFNGAESLGVYRDVARDAAVAEIENAQAAAAMAEKNVIAKQGFDEMAAQMAAAQGTLYSTSSGLMSVSSAAGLASGEVETLRQKIAMLKDKTVRVTYETIGTQEGNYTNAQAAAAVAESKKNAGYALGGIVPKAGMYPVGERGPEMVALPGGARVFSAQDTRRMQQQSGGVVVHAPVTIQATINSMLDVAVIAEQVSREIGRRVQQYRG